MERWRSYFEKAGADIWTVIQHAINIAAIDHPVDFREQRGEIAETLFARNLFEMHVRDSKHIAPEKHELMGCEARRPGPISKRPAYDDATHIKHPIIHANDEVSAQLSLHSYHQEAELSADEVEKDTLLIRDINCIKVSLTNGDQSENVVVEALQRLQYMQITVEALKATEIGKQVKFLKKHPSNRVRALVKELVRDWKVLVDEWANSAMDVTTVAATVVVETDPGDCPKVRIKGDRLPSSPPLDEGAHLEVGAVSVDLSKLFSFMDGEICTEDKDRYRHSTSGEPSVKNNLNYLSRSQSGSMLTDSSDFDTKASTNHSWGHRTPEERGSATRDVYPPSGKFEKEDLTLKGQTDIGWGLHSLKGMTNGTDQGRLCTEVLKGKPTSGGKQANSNDVVNWTHIAHKSEAIHASSADKSLLLKSDKSQVDQKLVIAKRKLHQGYQQAENAKKQRTVQVLDFPEGVKAGQHVKGKVNPPVQNKGIPPSQNRTGLQNSHGSQNRRLT